MLIGFIAYDKMFVVPDRFYNFKIIDESPIRSLSVLKLGKQYWSGYITAIGGITLTKHRNNVNRLS